MNQILRWWGGSNEFVLNLTCLELTDFTHTTLERQSWSLLVDANRIVTIVASKRGRAKLGLQVSSRHSKRVRREYFVRWNVFCTTQDARVRISLLRPLKGPWIAYLQELMSLSLAEWSSKGSALDSSKENPNSVRTTFPGTTFLTEPSSLAQEKSYSNLVPFLNPALASALPVTTAGPTTWRQDVVRERSLYLE